MDRRRRPCRRNAAIGQPGVLPTQQGLEFVRELLVVELARAVAFELLIERSCQARDDDIHQLLAHGIPLLAVCPTPGTGARRPRENRLKTVPLRELYAGPASRAKGGDFAGPDDRRQTGAGGWKLSQVPGG